MTTSLLNVDDILHIVPKLFENLHVTLTITLAALGSGLALGLILTLLQESRVALIRHTTRYYVDLMRGAPLALLILLLFYGGKLLLARLGNPVNLSDETFSILAITLSISCYFSEMMRSAYHAVDIGQKEAIQSVNIPPVIGLVRIILPQCVVLAIPNFGNLLINIVKMTSLVNIIGITDVFGRAEKISQNSYGAKQVAAFVSVVLIYWVLNSAISLLTRSVERKYRYLLD